MKHKVYRKPKIRKPIAPGMKIFRNKRKNKLDYIRESEEMSEVDVQLDLPFGASHA